MFKKILTPLLLIILLASTVAFGASVPIGPNFNNSVMEYGNDGLTIKSSGITHLLLAPDVISGMADVTSADADYILIWDATDSALKKVDMGEVRGGGAGETNTASNVGGQKEVFKQKSTYDLEFKTLKADSNQITLVDTSPGTADMGSAATDRDSTWGGYTFILKDNPADIDGTITSVEIWANTTLSNCEVATFTEGASNVFTTRDTEAIGTVTAGSKQTFSSLNLSVSAGDYIGIYASSGNIEQTMSGAGDWYKSGDNIPCTDATFALAASETLSVQAKSTPTPLDYIKFDITEGNIKLDDLGTPDDNTDLNASTSAHGLMPKLPNVATRFIDGTGAWNILAAGDIPTLNLTSFVEQTAWRVFYSNTDGDVTELALGADGTYLKSNGAAVAPTFSTPGGGGDVTKVGTPVDSQVGVWTGDGTIEGHSSLTYDRSNLQLTGDIGSTGTKITKGWFVDLEVANAIAGSITGNAATVTSFTPASGSLTLAGDDALTLTTTAGTDVTLPTTGTLSTLAGTESLSNKTLTLPIIKGTSASDLPTYSAEFLDADNWTSVNWTGNWAAGWDHTTGNITALSHDHNAVNTTKYQVTYTVTGRTAGTFVITFGGQTSASISATGAWGPTTTSTAVLTITPTTDFDGAIVISIKSITAISTAISVYKSSEDTIRMEIRGNTGTDNTFVGIGAGSYNTTGKYNVGIGKETLYYNTTGYGNIAMGINALRFNTVGLYNFAAGINALRSNISGEYNFGLGDGALYSNTSGDANVAIGSGALYYNTVGEGNIAIGDGAGQYHANGSTELTDPSHSIYLGYNVRAFDNDDDNSIVIGNDAIGKGANTTVIGNANTTNTYLYGKLDLDDELDAGAHTIGFTQQTVSYNVTTTTVDWKLSNKATVTLTGNVGTLAFTNPTNPCNVLLKIVQDGTGSRLITAYDADVKWAGGTKPTLTTTANGIDIISAYWDGTNYFGVASLAFAVP